MLSLFIDPEVQERDPEGDQRQYRDRGEGHRAQGPRGQALQGSYVRLNGKRINHNELDILYINNYMHILYKVGTYNT